MPSTFTNSLGIELPADGEKDGVWGGIVNDNMDIIDRATNGVVTVALAGTTHTLTTSDGLASDGQYHTVIFGGSPSGTNTVTLSPNDAQKSYHMVNASGQSVVITQGSGSNVTIPNGANAIVYADGAGATAAVSDFTAGVSLSITNIADVTSSAAELNLLDGVTATTAELNHLAGSNANLATFALPASTTISTYGATLVDDADAATARTTLGLGTIATQAASSVSITGGSITGITDLAVADGGTGASTSGGARTNLGLVIGTDVQAFDAGLLSIAGLTTAADRMIYTTASDTYAVATLTAAGRALLDDASASAQLTTLGAAPLASPALTGTPTAPTAAASDDSTQIATTAQVRTAIPDVLNAAGSAPLYACRAWVNFDGTGVVAIRDSGNVSSITDNGTGNYTVNFTTAMEDANYAVSASASRNNDSGYFGFSAHGLQTGQAAGSCIITTGYALGGGDVLDTPRCTVAVFR